MQTILRKRRLPLLSLESARPLSAFDVVGISLQYEMTYTNVLTLLDLGGIPLRARDRGDSDPLILGGGPTATRTAAPPNPASTTIPVQPATAPASGNNQAPVSGTTAATQAPTGATRLVTTPPAHLVG